jgi:cytochrome c oxidase subunit 4
VPVSLYIKVILLLMVLLIITLGAAMVDFSKISPALAPLNIVIAMTIAVVKAVLIILYFMHVRFSSKLVWVFAGAAFYWVVILFVLTLTDYMSRHMTNYPGQYTW